MKGRILLTSNMLLGLLQVNKQQLHANERFCYSMLISRQTAAEHQPAAGVYLHTAPLMVHMKSGWKVVGNACKPAILLK